MPTMLVSTLSAPPLLAAEAEGDGVNLLPIIVVVLLAALVLYLWRRRAG